MQFRVKSGTGVVLVLSGFPAWTQAVAQTRSASERASEPDPTHNDLKIGDPVWFVAGFIVGAAVGVIGAKVAGIGKSRN